MKIGRFLGVSVLLLLGAFSSLAQSGGLEFIDTAFENASPLWWEAAEDGTVRIHLVYDHERSSPNRAAGHVHFRIEGKPGTKVKLELVNLDNVWNGRPGSVAGEMKSLVVSEDGKQWRSVRPDVTEGRVRLEVELAGPELYVARVEPYRLSDLQRLLESIRKDSRVELQEIGQTAEGRPLEIVRIGNANAARRVFLRARAHPWEAGGNWVVEGLVARLLSEDAVAREFLDGHCVYILPMANKDGVARGRTRFNVRGKDLNRDWNVPASAELSPENYALERWLERQIKAGRAPQLALELHNDGNGKLHISRPPVKDLERYLKRMELLERLLRKHTWFTEGPTTAEFKNSGTLGEGWLLRYGIDATVHEFNCHWAAGLNRAPLAADWKNYGAKLVEVFADYFREAGGEAK